MLHRPVHCARPAPDAGQIYRRSLGVQEAGSPGGRVFEEWPVVRSTSLRSLFLPSRRYYPRSSRPCCSSLLRTSHYYLLAPLVVSGPVGRPWCVPPEPEPFPYDPEVVAGAHRPNMGGSIRDIFQGAYSRAGAPATALGAAGVEMLTTERSETGHRRGVTERGRRICGQGYRPGGSTLRTGRFSGERGGFRASHPGRNGYAILSCR